MDAQTKKPKPPSYYKALESRKKLSEWPQSDGHGFEPLSAHCFLPQPEQIQDYFVTDVWSWFAMRYNYELCIDELDEFEMGALADKHRRAAGVASFLKRHDVAAWMPPRFHTDHI